MSDKRKDTGVARLVALGSVDNEAEAKARAMLANERLRDALDDARKKAAEEAARPAPASEAKVDGHFALPRGNAAENADANDSARVVFTPKGADFHATTEVVPRIATRKKTPFVGWAVAGVVGFVGGCVVAALALRPGPTAEPAASAQIVAAPTISPHVASASVAPAPCPAPAELAPHASSTAHTPSAATPSTRHSPPKVPTTPTSTPATPPSAQPPAEPTVQSPILE